MQNQEECRIGDEQTHQQLNQTLTYSLNYYLRMPMEAKNLTNRQQIYGPIACYTI